MYNSPQLALDKKLRVPLEITQIAQAPIDVNDPQRTLEYYAKRLKMFDEYLSRRKWYSDEAYAFSADQWELFLVNVNIILDQLAKAEQRVQGLPSISWKPFLIGSIRQLRGDAEVLLEDAGFNLTLVESRDRKEELEAKIKDAQTQQSSTWFWWVSGAVLASLGVLYYRKRQRNRNV